MANIFKKDYDRLVGSNIIEIVLPFGWHQSSVIFDIQYADLSFVMRYHGITQGVLASGFACYVDHVDDVKCSMVNI